MQSCPAHQHSRCWRQALQLPAQSMPTYFSKLRAGAHTEAVSSSPLWTSPIAVDPCQPPATPAQPPTAGWTTASNCSSADSPGGLDRLLTAAFQAHGSSIMATPAVQLRKQAQALVLPHTALQQQLQQQQAQKAHKAEEQRQLQQHTRLQLGGLTPAAQPPKQARSAKPAPAGTVKALQAALPSLNPSTAPADPANAQAAASQPYTAPSLTQAVQHKLGPAGPLRPKLKGPTGTLKAPVKPVQQAAGSGNADAAQVAKAAPRKRKAPEEVDAAAVRVRVQH